MDFGTDKILEEPFFGQNIQKYSQAIIKNKPYVVFSGFPYDEGSKINNGIGGGRFGSTVFRQTLLQSDLIVHNPIDVYDSGDISSELTMEQAHEEIFKKHLKILQKKDEKVLFVIGGSRDQSYPNARALIQAYQNKRIGVINVDSHSDIRPLKNGRAHSGGPFRIMLENETFLKNKSKFIQFGNKGATNPHEHTKYLLERGVDIYWLEKDIRLHKKKKQSQYLTQAGQLFEKVINELEKDVDFIFVTVDTDVVNFKWMPGVEVPSVIGGLRDDEIVEIMRIAGKIKKVKLVDFSEFNPKIEEHKSSRLLVELFYALSMAIAERK